MNIVMTLNRKKDTHIQIRIDEEIKDELRVVAELRGLKYSSVIHSLIVKAINEDKERYPERFDELKQEVKRSKNQPKKVSSEKFTKVKSPYLQKEVDLDLTSDNRVAFSVIKDDKEKRKA